METQSNVETAEDAVDRYQPRELDCREILTQPKNRGDVLFCPHISIDWHLMARMSDVVHTYIFCNPKKRRNLACPPELESCFWNNSSWKFKLCEHFQESAVDTGPLRDVLLKSPSSVVRYWTIHRTIGDTGDGHDGRQGELEQRELLAICLCADPAEVYKALFPSTADGPKFLCLHGAEWDGTELKTGIDNGDVAGPRYIMGKKNRAYSAWSYCWQAYALWEGCMVYQRRQTPDHQTRPPVDYPGFTLVNQMLRPVNVPEGFGVHITLDEYMEHGWSNYWNGPIFLDCADAARVAEIHADHPVEQLCIRGKPLGQALNILSETLSHIDPPLNGFCTGRLGFEDEAGCMGAVWQQIRQVCNHQGALRVYCENEVDIAAVRGFDCVVPSLP